MPDDNSPATKKDVQELRTEILTHVDQLRDDLTEQMRAWASPLEVRMRALPHMDERLSLLEERTSRLERREKRQ